MNETDKKQVGWLLQLIGERIQRGESPVLTPALIEEAMRKGTQL